MKKTLAIFGVLIIVIPFLVLAISPAFSDLEPDLNSHWSYTAPTINGIMASGEWINASVRSFTLYMRSRTDGSLQNKLNASMYVENDYTNLYIAVKIYNDTYWAQDFANRWKGFAILFNNNDGVLAQGDNGEGITTWTSSPFYSKNDLYYNASVGTWDADLNLGGKTNNGAIKFTHTGAPIANALGNWTFEMSIPLVGSDPGYDFNIAKSQLPKTLGFKVWFYDNSKGWDGVYPDDPSTSMNLNEVTNPLTYGDLIIHPLYYLTIQRTPVAGGTTIPSPGTYAYGYGTMVSVTANPSLGYTLDHWELDAVNVGSTNPYVVTMNQNHTLLAVFRTLVSVGGFSLKPTAIPSLAYYGAILAVIGLSVSIIRRRKR